MRVGRGPWSLDGSPPRPYRLALLLVLGAFLVGPVGAGLGKWIDEGGAPASTFGLLLSMPGDSGSSRFPAPLFSLRRFPR